MSKPLFWEKWKEKKNLFIVLSAEDFTQSAKR